MTVEVGIRQRKTLRLSHVVVGVMTIMVVALVYVWFQVNTTRINYAIAREMQVQERLIEEGRQLKMEIEVLESPRRIETIAKETLEMNYPRSDQVVLLDE